MEQTEKALLTKTIKDITVSGLSFLVDHNIKGAKLLQSGLIKAEDMIAHNETLRNILKLLEPIFTVVDVAVKGWLAANYGYLVPVYEWAKEVFKSMFNL